MAKRHFYGTLVFCLIAFAGFGQTVVQANRVIAKDSVRIGSKWIYFVVTDSTFTDVNHRQVASAKAIRDFVLANSGIGAVDSLAIAQDSILVGYSAGAEVTRCTIPFPAGYGGWVATADSGGTETVTDGETVTFAGGIGLSTVRAGATITTNLDNTAVTPATYGSATQVAQSTYDAQGRATGAANVSILLPFSQVTGLPDSAGVWVSGSGTNLRNTDWNGSASITNGLFTRSATGYSLDANLALRLIGGTTGSRPTGAAGMWYWNTSNNWYDVYDGTGWRNVAQIANTNGLGTSAFVPRFDTNGRLTNGIFRDDGTTAGLGIAASASYGLNMAIGLPSSKIRFELSGISQAYIDWDAGSTTAYKLGKNATGIYALTAGGSNNTSFGYYHKPSAFNVNNLFEIKAALSVKWRSNTSAHTSIAYFEGTSASTFVQINNNGFLGVNITPTQALHVSGNASITGAYIDSGGSSGSVDMTLSRTSAGTGWTYGSYGSLFGTTDSLVLVDGTFKTVKTWQTTDIANGWSKLDSALVYTGATNSVPYEVRFTVSFTAREDLLPTDIIPNFRILNNSSILSASQVSMTVADGVTYTITGVAYWQSSTTNTQLKLSVGDYSGKIVLRSGSMTVRKLS